MSHSAFIAEIGSCYVPEQFIFIDKSAKDECTLSQKYGYSYVSTRARSEVMFVRGKRYYILPALTLNGIVAVQTMITVLSLHHPSMNSPFRL